MLDYVNGSVLSGTTAVKLLMASILKILIKVSIHIFINIVYNLYTS